ncbi:MAG: beta-Ala-His dipeptidase [Solobacterium sp.]|nr:beta-Ala-His dipeptidase [Solobacterium sp.]
MEFDLGKRYCYYFNEISKIPHGSRNEKAVSDYVCEFARKHGLPYKQDSVWNVTIDKPASPGYENSEPVILQAHMDMVCEKNNDVIHDFEKDPLDLYVEDGWLHARGTTLGADDGTGVAYMLAILEDDTLAHPSLECIFTTMEEIGLVGAGYLTKEDLHGHRYISLDGGGVSCTTTSSAGVSDVIISKKLQYESCKLPGYILTVKGLKGGHSGGEIHMERGNANVLAARILKEAQGNDLDITLCTLKGGMKMNAIPREAVFTFMSDSAAEAVKASVQASAEAIRRELLFSDPGVEVVLQETSEYTFRIQKEISDALLNCIYLMPNGFQHRSMVIDGLTVASLNLGVISVRDDTVRFEIMIRSAEDSARHDLSSRLVTLASLLDLDAEVPSGYAGWAYSENSRMREIYRAVCERNGLEYKERATHGGLECGIIKGLDPDMDIITFGPISEAIHSPDERLELQSFDDAYRILCEILKDCR